MGCSSSSIGQDRFVLMLKHSAFLDFLIRNIEEDNEWNNSSLHLGEIISNENLNIINTNFKRFGSIVFNDKGISLNVKVKGIPESETTIYMPVGVTYMGLKLSNDTDSVTTQLISKNPDRSRVLGLDKIELNTLLGYICGTYKPQLQNVMTRSLYEIVANNVLFSGLTEIQCNYLQQFLRWRFVDRNISVFEKQSYETIHDVCALHILFDGNVVVVDPKAAAEKNQDIDKSLSFSNAVDGKGSYDSVIPSAMRVLPTSYYMCGVNLASCCSCNLCKHHKSEDEAVKDGQVQFHGQVMKVAKVNPTGSDYSESLGKSSMYSKPMSSKASNSSAKPSKYKLDDVVASTTTMHGADYMKNDKVPNGNIPDVGSIFKSGSIFEAELSFIEDSRVIMSKVEVRLYIVFCVIYVLVVAYWYWL